MNELITREMVETGVASDYVLNKIEEYKTAVEWMDTFKYEFQKFCEENGLKKWETDYFNMNYIGLTFQNRVNTNKMKNSSIYVIDGETGELVEVNAYDYFLTKSPMKAHVTYKEKK